MSRSTAPKYGESVTLVRWVPTAEGAVSETVTGAYRSTQRLPAGRKGRVLAVGGEQRVFDMSEWQVCIP